MRVSKKGAPIPYRPDFVYKNRHRQRVYHEHFGVDEQGRAPSFLGKEYEDRVCQKRIAFREHFGPRNSHLYFETTSGQMRTGRLFKRFEEELRVRDIAVGEVNTAIRDRALAEFRKRKVRKRSSSSLPCTLETELRRVKAGAQRSAI